MAREKQLSKRQLAVLDDLFGGELDEQAVLDKHQVSRSLYDRWLADSLFAEQLERRIAGLHRQSRLIIARYAPLAAAKLVELTGSDSQETARKACLDIISLPMTAQATGSGKSQPADMQEPPQLSEQAASRLLAALAEDEEDEKTG
jgi:hypothetical protein